nr:hypothetical protein [Arthrobacter sp. AET 35A]
MVEVGCGRVLAQSAGFIFGGADVDSITDDAYVEGGLRTGSRAPGDLAITETKLTTMPWTRHTPILDGTGMKGCTPMGASVRYRHYVASVPDQKHSNAPSIDVQRLVSRDVVYRCNIYPFAGRDFEGSRIDAYTSGVGQVPTEPAPADTAAIPSAAVTNPARWCR